jgi:hypothetical protein
MLEATLSPFTTTLKTTTTAPAPTSTFTPLLFAIDAKNVMMPAAPAPAPVDTAFACTNNICYGSGDVDFLFRTLQNLINNANKRLRDKGLPAGVDIVIDGRIDARTLNVYMPISRAVGGTLAIFDFTPDPKYLASNARNIALGIATWLGLTWVAEAGGVPGHWARMSAGQTVQLPPPPAPVSSGTKTLAPTAPTAPTVQTAPTPTTRPTVPIAPTAPTPTTRPTAPAPMPQAVAPAQTVAPVEPLPPPSTPETEGKFRGCIARFNRTRKVFAIYCPIGSEGATPGLGVYDAEYFRCLGTNCTGLGADTVTPPPPAGFVKAVEVTTLPRAGETQSGDERDKFFRLGNPLMWAAFAGTAAVVGGGGYMLYRRKRAK